MESKGFIIRDVFQTKPGKAKDLVKIFKAVAEAMKKEGFVSQRIMTDFVANYWTVVLEIEVRTMEEYIEHSKGFTAKPEIGEIMKGYMDLVQGGHREIFRIE